MTIEYRASGSTGKKSLTVRRGSPPAFFDPGASDSCAVRVDVDTNDLWGLSAVAAEFAEASHSSHKERCIPSRRFKNSVQRGSNSPVCDVAGDLVGG